MTPADSSGWILCHRGLWHDQRDQNTRHALTEALANGFGIETDLRDCGRELVIAHDPPSAAALTAGSFVAALPERRWTDTSLALNIKADGLQDLLRPHLASLAAVHAFVFDTSVPDTLGWIEMGVPVFTRQSEVEPEPAFYNAARGVWLDALWSEWYDRDLIERHLERGKDVCVVSPELNGRPPMPCWSMLSALRDSLGDDGARVLLCTDLPHEARRAFGP